MYHQLKLQNEMKITIIQINHYDFINAQIIHKLKTDIVANIKSFVAIKCDGGNFAPLRSLAIFLSSNHGRIICKISGSINPTSLIT